MRKVLFLLLVACRAPATPSHLEVIRATDHETNLGAIDSQFAGAMLASYHQRAKEAVAPLSLTPTDGSELALTALKADITIEGPLAHTELHMTFHNTEGRQREGRFQITLPPQAAIGRFAMLVDGAWREARVVARARGQQMFESYLHKRVDPALLEQDHGNGFSARVFPIPANGDKEIIIAYDHRISELEPYQLALRGLPKTQRLAIHVANNGATTTRNLDNEVPDDVIVPTAPGNEAVAAGELFVARVDLAASAAKAPLDRVVILVDTSASRAPIMGRQADVLQQLVANLPDDAHVTVAAFDQGVTELYRGAARDAGAVGTSLQRHGALGASDLGGALAMAAASGAARVILIGDGTPTLGEHRAGELAKLMTRVERVDAVQVGQTIDRAMLAPIVAAGIKPGAILDARELHHVVRGLETAVAEEQLITVPGALQTWPATTQGLAPGEPAFVVGRRAPGHTLDALDVRIGAHSAHVAPIRADPQHLDRAVAMGRVAELQTKLGKASDAERPALQKELEQLGIDHDLVTAETSLIVLESDAEETRQFGPRPQQPVAQAQPSKTVGEGEVIRISDTAPVIDPGSTSQGITIDKEYIQNVPVPGRTFEGVLGAASGSQSDAFHGGTSLENKYIVEHGDTMSLGDAEPAWIVDHMTRAAMEEKAEREPVAQPAYVPPPEPEQHYESPYTGPMAQIMTSLAHADRAKALEIASKWQLDNPGEVAALIGLGEALEARGSLILAERAYTSIIDLYPDRTELVRAAGERLDRIPGARSLAIDAYRRAIRERPDQLSTYRLLAYDLMLDNKLEALQLIDQAMQQPVVHWSVRTILEQDRSIMAAHLLPHDPGADHTPSVRFILSWETDGNDVDLHTRDRLGDHAWYGNLAMHSGGTLLEDVRDGYGPEMFSVEHPDAFPYKIGVHYYARGPEGVGLGSVQIIRNDGHGNVTVEDRPFMIQSDQAYVDLGTVAK
ncbi:MAG TPA: VIT domain-containing protein [Kofleriaceae bacterium]|nr:VIT domain-containing protein [Kofleriaceae bacterium]